MVHNGEDSLSIIPNLAKALSINENDIELKITTDMPDISQSFSYTIKNGKLQQDENAIKANKEKLYKYAKDCYTSGNYVWPDDKEYDGYSGSEDDWNEVYELYAGRGYEAEQKMIEMYSYEIVYADAILPDGTIYKLAIGENDEWDMNWLLEKVSGPEQPIPSEFNTTMDYQSKADGNVVSGKMSDDGSTYLPPYYDDDNNKKDADVTVTVKSTTDETIVATKGVELTDKNTKDNPNSEGWYYPDLNNKTVIAKDYPFDKYDNTTNNGIIKEDVALTGGNGGKSSQTPSIKWTFRRKNKEQTSNSDGSTTVTITYNLPIDKDSIPEGWSPVYDEDKTTIHKITRTFKKGENYDEDVRVKQNGTGVPNTTHVTIKSKPDEIPRAGQNMTLAIGILLVAIVAITRYFKAKKYKI